MIENFQNSVHSVNSDSDDCYSIICSISETDLFNKLAILSISSPKV